MGIETIFDSISSSYSTVTDFFDDLGGLSKLADIGDKIGMGGDSSKGAKDTPKGAMASILEEDDDFDLTPSEAANVRKQLATRKEKQKLSQMKLALGPQSVDYKEAESMWMNRLSALAQGKVYGQEEEVA